MAKLFRIKPKGLRWLVGGVSLLLGIAIFPEKRRSIGRKEMRNVFAFILALLFFLLLYFLSGIVGAVLPIILFAELLEMLKCEGTLFNVLMVEFLILMTIFYIGLDIRKKRRNGC